MQSNNQPMPIRWASELLNRFRMMYGQKFADQWGQIDTDELAHFWSQELAGFTPGEIKTGLDACKSRPWPPTLPEFMVLCRPPMNAEAKFHESVAGIHKRRAGQPFSWSHPAVYWAMVAVGHHDILGSSYRMIGDRWQRALSDELAKGQWDPIPDPVAALPEPKRTAESDAQAEQVAGMAARVLSDEQRDHKAWARKILDNPKGRTPTIVAMARRALDESAA